MVSEDRALYWRLLGYVKPYWKAFGLAVVGMMGTAATEPAFPAIMKYLLDHGFKTEDQRLVWLIPISIIALFAIRGLLSFLTSYLMTWISTRLICDLRRDLFAKILVLPTQTFHDQSSGQLISKVLYDVDNVNQAATNVLVIAVRESLTAIALMSYLLYLNWKLTLLSLAIGPVIAFIIRGFGKRIRKASRESFHAMQTIAHTVEETAVANKVIKIYGAQEQQSQRFFANTERFRRSMMREAVPASALTPITHLTASVAIAAITFLALSQSIDGGGTSAGGFVSFVTTLLLLISPIKQLTTISPIMQRGLSACESVFHLLDSPSEADEQGQLVPHVRGEIEFKNVSFRYPNAERDALFDVTFKVNAGQTVALVGASGGGKSTISSLIPRFYALSSGKVLIDGKDINDFRLSSLRSHIGLVSQDIVLLNDTVLANIAFGMKGKPDRQQVIAAARSANAWEFIDQLPNGIDTPIGENGAKLSGGQRQRIAIARAVLRNAPILILDEATSALDTESERLVQSALATLMENKTTLVIAHRLSTIEKADQILVLDQGRVVERGNHAELLNLAGVYANLHKMQT
jgi:subfamily B ATP-binding cassette protein MsbA